MSRAWISNHRTAQRFRLIGGALALSTAALGAAACGSDPVGATAVVADSAVASDAATVAAATATTSDATVARHYVVFPNGVPAKGWRLVEAVRLTGEGRKAQQELDPALDWFAEYLGPGTNLAKTPHLSVSGHSQSLRSFREDHPVDKGVKVKRGQILGHPAVWGSDPELGTRFVAFAIADGYTIELTAGLMTLAELRRMANTLEETDEAGWRAAGGAVVDCVPEDDCPGVDPGT